MQDEMTGFRWDWRWRRLAWSAHLNDRAWFWSGVLVGIGREYWRPLAFGLWWQV